MHDVTPTERTLIVNGHDIFSIVQAVGANRLMRELITSLADALHRPGARTRVVPRAGFTYDRPAPGALEWMPALVVGEQAVIKIVGYHPRNPRDHRRPTVTATIAIYDVRTGHLTALLDGVLPTALRTGAASALATRVLARPDSSVIGLVGCGAQAVTQLQALSLELDVTQVLVYDIDPDASATFSDRVAFLQAPVTTVAREVLEAEADVICTATSAPVGTGPVIDDRQLKPWVHVNAVGSDLPGKTELSPSFLRRSVVCPDYAEQALAEGEAQQLEAEELGPSLGELLEDAESFHRHRERPTVFDSTGFALEDIVAANLLLGYASELGIGRPMSIEATPADPRTPYLAPIEASLTDGDQDPLLTRPLANQAAWTKTSAT